jgi:serine/threonine-protein kinase
LVSGTPVAPVAEGDLLAGKYRVDKVLGVGGMGVVVAAHHIGLDDRVAIKFLLPEMLASAESVARFEREARAAVKIKSEHVARVSDVGKFENGAPYLVMEYLEGSDLAAWLEERGPLSVEQASEFVLQACEAIAEAHSLGIVHRDLKPANLFVIRRPDGALSVKVLDFGISKMRAAGTSVPDVSITKTSAIMGSPLYMSPEQMQSAKDVDSRTDIWALGVILYELVAGETPFMGERIEEVIAKIISMPAPPLRHHRADVPQAFEAVIARCIEKDRSRRYESVGELAAALAPFAPRRSRISLERISGILRAAGLSATALATPPSSDAKDQTQGTFGRTGATRGRATWTLVVAAMVVLIGASAFALFREAPVREPEAPATSLAAQPAVLDEAPNRNVESPSPTPPNAVVDARTASVGAAAPAPSSHTAPTKLASSPRPTQTATTRLAQPSPPPQASAPLPPPSAVKPVSAPTRKAPGAFDDRK